MRNYFKQLDFCRCCWVHLSAAKVLIYRLHRRFISASNLCASRSLSWTGSILAETLAADGAEVMSQTVGSV